VVVPQSLLRLLVIRIDVLRCYQYYLFYENLLKIILIYESMIHRLLIIDELKHITFN